MAIDFNRYINSTGTHYISNSGKDEKGTYHGGAAGDQSGHGVPPDRDGDVRRTHHGD